MYNYKRYRKNLDGGIIMKKKILALLATLILTFAFSANCFAAVSPTGDVLPTEEENPSGDGNGGNNGTDPNDNKSQTSPKTGANLALGFVAVISAAGVALVSKRKYSEAE